MPQQPANHVNEDPKHTHRDRLVIGLGIAIVLATVAVYARTATYPFIVYDDPGYVYQNPHVRSGISAKNILWAFTARERSNWHPLTWLSHMGDAHLFGMRAGGHHLTNALIHAVNALLVFIWLYRTTRKAYPSAFAGLVFGLHPLHVESVAWISERKDVLCAFFFLCALLAHSRFAHRGTFATYALTTTCFALALMSKPMAVTWPCVAILADLWPLQRFNRKTALPCIIEKLPWFALSAASCVITLYAQTAGQAVRTLEHVPLALRVENAAFSYVRYMGQSFVPRNLVPFYPLPTDHHPVFAIPAVTLVLAAVSALAIATLRTFPFIFSGWFWFVGMLVPTIGLVQVGDQSMANRYMYLPQIGLSIAVIWPALEIVTRRPRLLPFARLAFVGTSLAMAGLTWIQIGYWSDSIRLFQRTIDIAESPEARTLLGYAHQLNGNSEAALQHYARATELDPRQVIALNNIASIYNEQERWKDAERASNRAIATGPQHAPAYLNLGIALQGQGRTEEAATQYATAVRIQPDYVAAYEKLGGVSIILERYDAAASALQTAVQLAAERVDNWINLAIAHAGAKRFDASESAFQKALALAPGNRAARINRARMLWHRGDNARAIVELTNYVGNHPDDAEAVELLRAIREADEEP